MILVQAIASFLPKITAPAPTDHDQLCLGIYKEENQTVTLVDVMIVPQINSSDKGVCMWPAQGNHTGRGHMIGLCHTLCAAFSQCLHTSARIRPETKGSTPAFARSKQLHNSALHPACRATGSGPLRSDHHRHCCIFLGCETV